MWFQCLRTSSFFMRAFLLHRRKSRAQGWPRNQGNTYAQARARASRMAALWIKVQTLPHIKRLRKCNVWPAPCLRRVWAVSVKKKRAFGSPLASDYKTHAILCILTLSITIGHRHADRTWRSWPYIRRLKCIRAKSVLGRIFFFNFYMDFVNGGTKKTAVALRFLQSDT